MLATMSLPTSKSAIVVFRLFPSLGYAKRVILSFLAIVAGFSLQVLTMYFFPGIVLVAVGNLFLLTKGYDNNVDFGSFKPNSQWQRATREKLLEIKSLSKKIKIWDRSLIDITNGFGLLTFLIIAGICGYAYLYAIEERIIWIQLLTVNLALLFLPHWITGVRTILTQANLILKVDCFLELLKKTAGEIPNDEISVSLLVEEDKDKTLPSDVKLILKPKKSHPDFLGLQAQIALNVVQGSSYIYFYVVLLAKKGYGLNDWGTTSYAALSNTITEFSYQDDVEVLVIRQKTTKTSGYYTKPKVVTSLFLSGANFANIACEKPYSQH